jgi:hypothetical protein
MHRPDELSSFVDVTALAADREEPLPVFDEIVSDGAGLVWVSTSDGGAPASTPLVLPEVTAGMKSHPAVAGHIYVGCLANVHRGGLGVPDGGDALLVFEVLRVVPGDGVSLRWKLFPRAET